MDRAAVIIIALVALAIPASASAASCPDDRACGYTHPSYTGARKVIDKSPGWRNLGPFANTFGSVRNRYQARKIKWAMQRNGNGLKACTDPQTQSPRLWGWATNNIESYRVGARDSRCARYESPPGGATGVRGKGEMALAGGGMLVAILAAAGGVARWVQRRRPID